MIKRYRKDHNLMIENKNGGWVKYEDVRYYLPIVYNCLDCGKPLMCDNGLVSNAWGRTLLGKGFLGFVCNDCHDINFL